MTTESQATPAPAADASQAAPTGTAPAPAAVAPADITPAAAAAVTDAVASASQPATPEASAPAAAPPAKRAPEAYEPFKLPEGRDPAVLDMDGFSNMARELDLPQADAQKLVDYQESRIAAAFKGWNDATIADPEIGGTNLEASLALAKKGLDAVGNDALKTMLNRSGLGSHPEIVRAFAKVGKSISEDAVLPSGRHASGEPVSVAQRLYPNMNP